MSEDGATPRPPVWGLLLCLVCVLALLPATWLAYIGIIWLPGLEGRSLLSAAALVAGPLPFIFGALFGWRAVQRRQKQSLHAGVLIALLALPLYAVPLAWGGRMLM